MSALNLDLSFQRETSQIPIWEVAALFGPPFPLRRALAASGSRTWGNPAPKRILSAVFAKSDEFQRS